MDGQAWLDDMIALYRDAKTKAERAVAQVSDDEFFQSVGQVPLSLAILLKHVGRNHRSRWRDFLTTDGEKRDRDRESEFTAVGETKESILAQWEEGWNIAFDQLGRLTPADLTRTITIRGEPHTVVQAIHRNREHVVYHLGQVVFLARHFAGEQWQTLSIAPGESDAFNARMRQRFGDWWAEEPEG